VIRRIETGVALCLGLLIVGDAALFIRFQMRAHRPPSAVSLYRPGVDRAASTRPVAFEVAGSAVNDISPRPRTGWAVRYVSRNCGYSASDSNWPRMASELERLGYPITLLAPRVGDEMLTEKVTPAGTRQAAFVSIDWIKSFQLTMTPTLLVFDSHGQLIWHHEGTLAPRDIDAAARALGTYPGQDP